MDEFLTLTCTLSGGGTVTFDVPDTTADDIEETVTIADYFISVLGT